MTPKLAILYDPAEIFSPSNRVAIDNFINAAAGIGLETRISGTILKTLKR